MPATGTFRSPMSETEMAMVPLFDLRLEDEDLDAVAETLRSGWLTQGPRVAAFEAAFADHLGTRHAVAVSSCTAALHLAYRAAGVGPGDEVIVPALTFVATAAAVIHCGATPVFADVIGVEDPSLDPEDVASRITPRTRAVTAVHFAGYPAPVDALAVLCEEHGIALVEDCAHSPSATLHGRKLGTWGLAGAFSFFSNKILSAGEGGLLTTDDDDIAESARRARSHCMTSGTWERHSRATDTYDVTGLGYNYRLDEPRAALLLSRLARLEADIERRRELTRSYRERLAGLEGLTVPFRDEQVVDASCYIMPLMVDDPTRRREVRRILRDEHGIQTTIMYPAVHELAAYSARSPDLVLPHAERAARSELTVPMFPHMTAEDLDRTVTALQNALSG